MKKPKAGDAAQKPELDAISARQKIAEQQQSDDFLTNLERLRQERRKRDRQPKPE